MAYRTPAPAIEPDFNCRTCGAPVGDVCGHGGKWPRVSMPQLPKRPRGGLLASLRSLLGWAR